MIASIAVGALRTFAAFVRLLPPRLYGPIATVGAWGFWLGSRKHRTRTLANLDFRGLTGRAARRFGIASFRSNFLVFLETLAVERLLAERGATVRCEVTPAAQQTLAALSAGEIPMAMSCSGHLGCWELMGAYFAQCSQPVPCAVSARLPKAPSVKKFLRETRQSFGLELIEKDTFLRFTIQKRRAAEPYNYMFLLDQHFKGGERLPFLERPACTVTVPAHFALKYDAPILLGFAHRIRPGSYRLTIDLVDVSAYKEMPLAAGVSALTRHLNDAVGAAIEVAPEQWTWGHRRWRACCDEVAAPASSP
ncbi:MAG: hypothetical protein AAF581_10020 [Planctomycetota bacterium]